MDSQNQQTYIDEKAGFLDDEASFAGQQDELARKAHMRKLHWRGVRAAASMALLILVWRSFEATSESIKANWNDRTIKNSLEEGHMSFDTVRIHLSVLRYRN